MLFTLTEEEGDKSMYRSKLCFGSRILGKSQADASLLRKDKDSHLLRDHE